MTKPSLRLAGVLAAIGLLSLGCQKEEPKPGPNPPIVIAPGAEIVPGDAMIVVHVNAELVWKSDAFKAFREKAPPLVAEGMATFEKTFGLPLTDLQSLTVIVPGLQAKPVLIGRTSKPYDSAKVKAALRADEKGFHTLGDRAFILGDAAAAKPFLAKPDDQSYLTPALRDAAGKHHLVAGFRVPPEVAGLLASQLPPEVKELQPLTELKSGMVTVDLGKSTDYQAVLVFPDADKAKSGVRAVRSAMTMARTQLTQFRAEFGKRPEFAPFRDYFVKIEEALVKAKIEQSGANVQIVMSLEVDLLETTAVLVPAIQKVREAANRMTSASKLSNIGVALHVYHNDNNSFPPAVIADKDGKPVLSWRVAILPYLEQQDLYNKFKQDEPWDSPHNKALLKQMPDIYAPPTPMSEEPFGTYYQAFVGKTAAFDPTRKVTLAMVKDGTSNTIFVVEAAKPVPWTKPEDIPYDDEKPLPKLGGTLNKDGFSALMGDRAVIFFKNTLDEKILRALITRNGGEDVRLPD